MLFGNHLLAELQLIFKAMQGIKEDLLALEKGNIESTRKQQLFTHLFFLLGHIKDYSKKELELFAQDELSKSCTKILREISPRYFHELNMVPMHPTQWKTPKNFPFEKLRELIGKVEEAERTLLTVEKEVKFELQQKRKARSLSRSEVDPKSLGCYHFTPIRNILHIMRNGLISLEYAQRELQHELAITLEGFQGEGFISVFDTYSYWKLYQYFLAKNSLARILENKITEEDLLGALKANKNLNFSRFAEVNIEICNRGQWFEGDSMYVEFFQKSMRLCAEGKRLRSFSSGSFYAEGEIILIINDTAHFFPKDNSSAYEFEAIFKDKITPDKIVGIILTKKAGGYIPLIQELVKFIGIPLYDPVGRLIWPTK